jgi:hypothetical protein
VARRKARVTGATRDLAHTRPLAGMKTLCVCEVCEATWHEPVFVHAPLRPRCPACLRYRGLRANVDELDVETEH